MKLVAKLRSTLRAKIQFKKLLFIAAVYFLTVSAVAAKLSHRDVVPAPSGEPSRLFLITFGFLIFFIVYQLPLTRKLTKFHVN